MRRQVESMRKPLQPIALGTTGLAATTKHLMWKPIHSGIAACLLDGLTRAQMIAALGRSNQGITYRMAQMREMLGVRHRGQLLVELIKMQHAPLPLRLR